MVVYETTIDTVFICFLVDEEVNGTGKMFASEKLQRLVGKYKPESDDMAASLKYQDRRIQDGGNVNLG